MVPADTDDNLVENENERVYESEGDPEWEQEQVRRERYDQGGKTCSNRVVRTTAGVVEVAAAVVPVPAAVVNCPPKYEKTHRC